MQHHSRISRDEPSGSASRTAIIDTRTRSSRPEEPRAVRAPALADPPTGTARRKTPSHGTRLSVLKSRGRKVAALTARFLGWATLTIACYWLAEFGEIWNIPAPQLVVPMLVGIAVALTGLVRSPFPKRASRAVQAMVGVLMGSYLHPRALAAVVTTSLPLIAVTITTIMCCGLAALWLARDPRISIIDALLGMVPGGSGGIIACAHDLGADSRQVAFAQYLRVGLIALTAPLIVMAVGGRGAARSSSVEWPAFAHWVQQPQGVRSVVVLAAICLLGIRLGERLRLPAPVLLGPMVAAAIVTLTDTWTGFAPAGPLEDMLFVVIGLEVGLRFTRPAIRGTARILPRLLTAIGAVYLLCTGLSWAAATVTGIPFVEAYLATTPGGINAVLATAVSSQSDVPLISAVQSFRLFLALLLIPPLVRWLGTRFTPTIDKPTIRSTHSGRTE
ncbi:AbrB family transcriptional regulator [Nocardia brevicatena]|uniref:AbrB family transcriptional regulator n=1 Tax=Nocardia brevicatena TaxID=37327 RepID=UPI0006880D26|nr:AbrB family transcriptional regulator [Nocardia brevicatena]